MMRPLLSLGLLLSLSVSTVACALPRASGVGADPAPGAGDGAGAGAGAEGGRLFGATEIARWQDGKTGAVSLTFDDGIRTQFTRTIPTMDRLGLPGTFYVVTGEIAGSRHPARFVGRPIEEIVAATATVPTSEANFFERASALQYPGYEGAYELHRTAYNAYERGRVEEAHRAVDEAYARIRAGEFPRGRNTTPEAAQSGENTWEFFRQIAARGHEFGSHTVTHAGLAALDEANMLYELESSRDDILTQLGRKHTFSVEGPFGVSHPRAMEYLLRLFPAPRNIMPDPWLEILLRGSRKAPGSSDREYVQWQRGPDGNRNDSNTTETSLEQMTAWVDSTLAHPNVWLTLVFHGIDEVGWSALPGERVDAFLEYVKAHEDRLWVATFGDVTRYVRERMSATVEAEEVEGRLSVRVTHPLDPAWYGLPLTLKTYVESDAEAFEVRQGDELQRVRVRRDAEGRSYILYRVATNAGPVTVSGRE